MKLVVENTDEETEQRHVLGAYQGALIRLTANLLRILRGSGKPYEIGAQVADVLVAMESYHKAIGRWPDPSEARQALSLRKRRLNHPDGSVRHEKDAKAAIIRAALQAAASVLLDQAAQLTQADRELSEGITQILALREEERRPRAAERAHSNSRPQPSAGGKSKPRTKPKAAPPSA